MAKFSAIVLAGGSGRRMGTDTKKQYMMLKDRPVICYPLKTFEESGVDEIVLVTAEEDMDYVRTEIVERYGYKKVKKIVPGGRERYDSVYEGIRAADGHFVIIHDGARAFITKDIIERTMTALEEYGAVVVGMPSKDTVKVADPDGFVDHTPKRSLVWSVQTPQAFIREELLKAYDMLLKREDGFSGITDDAMIMERTKSRPIKLIEGSYDNIKLTTPEDLAVAREILQEE